MLGEFGEAVVMDWGLAKPLGKSAHSGADVNIRTMVSSLRKDAPEAIETMEGAAIGTPAYMSPEQADGRSRVVDARTDVYGLGAILYSILTLCPPVGGTDSLEVMKRVIGGEITPPENAVREHTAAHLPDGKLPPSLTVIALKALSLNPADRYPGVRELQAALHDAQFDGRQRTARFSMDFFRGRKKG